MDWSQFPYGSVLPQEAVAEVTAKWSADETTTYTQEVRFFDFEANGKPFTQVAIVLTPAEPLVIDGKRVVMVVSEPGHDSAREFVEDDLRREGPGPWLARRGVTFIALCRLGRWNFLTDDPLGSWKSVPLEQRMPIFHRGQKAHWPASEYETIDAGGVSSPTGSAFCRMPRRGSALEAHMMAVTPATVLRGFRIAIEACGVVENRKDILLLYWGFSTGGAFLWALAKSLAPDGVASFGMANFPISYYATRGFKDEHRWLYDKSAFRVRERNYADFAFFSPDLTEEERQVQWQEALNSARFKSYEDTFMFFNAGALTESLARLWNEDFLPADVRERGFAALVRENIDLSFPDDTLRTVRCLELAGTRDEIQPPEVTAVAASVTRRHLAAHHLLFIEGYHHSIAADQVPAFASIWLEAIAAGYFTAS